MCWTHIEESINSMNLFVHTMLCTLKYKCTFLDQGVKYRLSQALTSHQMSFTFIIRDDMDVSVVRDITGETFD
jgi:hypothetical protein